MRFPFITMAAGVVLAAAPVRAPATQAAKARLHPVPPAVTSAVSGGHYIVDREHTGIDLSVANIYSGHMSDVSGTLDLSAVDPEKSTLMVSVPVATLMSGNGMIDATLKSADWLDAERYPTVSFATTRIVPSAGDRAEVIGDLTLHGMTRPVTFAVRLSDSSVDATTRKHTARFEITGDISRNAFGMPAMSLVIPDVVHLNIVGAFEQT